MFFFDHKDEARALTNHFFVGLSFTFFLPATPRIWQGVFTDAQAERGQTRFNTACIRCHGSRR